MSRHLCIRTLAAMCVLGCIRPAFSATETAAAAFDRAYATLVQADRARDRADLIAAERLYRQVLSEYRTLQSRYPDLQRGIVQFRVSYCENQLASVQRQIDEIEFGPTPETDAGAGEGFFPPPLADDAGTPFAGVQETSVAQIRNRGYDLLRARRTDEARQLLMAGLLTHPDEPMIRLLTAVAQCQAGEYGDAMYVLESVCEDHPDDPAPLVALAGAFVGLGRIEDARVSLESALDIDPDCGAAHFNLGQILLLLDPPEVDGAAVHFRRALGGAPEKTEVHLFPQPSEHEQSQQQQ